MSMKRSHARVMDLWDSGRSIEQIAQMVGKPRGQVKIIVSTYDGSADRRVHRASMCAGSAALLAAIQQVRA